MIRPTRPTVAPASGPPSAKNPMPTSSPGASHDDSTMANTSTNRSSREMAAATAAKPRERPTGTRSAQTREKRHRRGCGAFRETRSGRPGRSSRGSTVVHQPGDRCGSAIDRAIRHEPTHRRSLPRHSRIAGSREVLPVACAVADAVASRPGKHASGGSLCVDDGGDAGLKSVSLASSLSGRAACVLILDRRLRHRSEPWFTSP